VPSTDRKLKKSLGLIKDILGSGGTALPFLTLALDDGQWWASHPGQSSPRVNSTDRNLKLID
jgi:hypothetical protein